MSMLPVNSMYNKVMIYSVHRYTFPWIEIIMEVLKGKCVRICVWKILGKNTLSISISCDKD